MFTNCLAAALRHLSRNRLYTAIGVLGLAVGLWAALLAALEVRNQFSYDHFVDGYRDVYLGVSSHGGPGLRPEYQLQLHVRAAARLQLNVPGIRAVTRLMRDGISVQHDAVQGGEAMYWADPTTFEVLPLPVVAGDLAGALRRPDAVVLPRSIARKYFGHDTPLGETLLLGGTHPMTVTAVVEDLPANATTLETAIFASGLAPWSRLAAMEADPRNGPDSDFTIGSARTYLRLKAGTLLDQVRRDVPAAMRELNRSSPPVIELVRLDRVNTHSGVYPGFAGKMAMIVVLGAVSLLIAGINFVNLLTARSAQRALEVSLRKICGAQRHTLVLQFLGESLLYALAATVLAVTLTEWSLPYANAFLDAGATFDYWREPALLGVIALATAGFGVLAGVYPAFVLTAYRPVGVLNGWTQHSRNAGAVRQVLVTLQFAILITLMICTGVVYLQRHYATQDALRADTDQMLAVSPCSQTFVAELRGLQGVRGVACSGLQILGPQGYRSMSANWHISLRAVDGSSVTVNMVPIDFGLFDLFGVPPIAGQLSTTGAETTSASNAAYVINETAARQLGFASPQAAVGQHVRPPAPGPDRATSAEEHEVIAVIPDFTLASIEQRIEPTVYFAISEQFGLTMVKLGGREIPETLAAIDKLWTKVGGSRRINRFFIEDHIQLLYLAMLRQAQAFSLFSGIAVVLALVGLLGLAASAAERRTKEIGIRKSMGAQTGDIVRLLLWQFTKPVVWACLIAWPVAGYLMQRWLQGFAYHVDMPLWLFPAAGCTALLIAMLTVGGHSFLVARAKPVTALRYE